MPGAMPTEATAPENRSKPLAGVQIPDKKRTMDIDRLGPVGPYGGAGDSPPVVPGSELERVRGTRSVADWVRLDPR